MLENTIKLLELSKKHNYKRIAIGVKNKGIPHSMTFPFGPQRSVFGWPDIDDTTRIDGWPAIWRIVEQLKANGGAGNTHQMQIKSGMLLNGYYYLDKNGVWRAKYIWKKPSTKERSFPLDNIITDRDLCVKMHNTKACKDICVCKRCMNREKRKPIKGEFDGLDNGYCSQNIYYDDNKRNYYIKRQLGCTAKMCAYFVDWISYLRSNKKG